jgi:hypothetical protein
MPFTFSHPAIVLPLASKRLRLSATGLIVGSMTPDFEYFIRMKNVSRYSHTISGLLWFDLPFALLLCFIYHLIVRNSLFDNLPVFLKEKLHIFKKFQWTNFFKAHWMIVCVSILIGAASHILWDAVAHDTMFFVQRDPDLSDLMQLGSINLASYRFLQLTSSVFGLLVVIISILALKKHPPVEKKINYNYWWLILLIVTAVMFMRVVGGLNIHDNRRILVSFISSVIIALILTPMVLTQQEQIRREQRAEKTP